MPEYSLICTVVSKASETFVITLTDSAQLVQTVPQGSSAVQVPTARIDPFGDNMSVAVYFQDGRLLYVPSQAQSNAPLPLLGTWQSAQSRHRMIVTECMSGLTPLSSEWYCEQLQYSEMLPDVPLPYRRNDLVRHLDGSETLDVQAWIWNGKAYID